MARQKEIPGTERPKIPEVETAGEALHSALKAQAKAKARVTDTKATLIAAMRSAKVTTYRDDEAGILITLADGPVKVTITEVDPEGDEADEGAAAPN